MGDINFSVTNLGLPVFFMEARRETQWDNIYLRYPKRKQIIPFRCPRSLVDGEETRTPAPLLSAVYFPTNLTERVTEYFTVEKKHAICDSITHVLRRKRLRNKLQTVDYTPEDEATCANRQHRGETERMRCQGKKSENWEKIGRPDWRGRSRRRGYGGWSWRTERTENRAED